MNTILDGCVRHKSMTLVMDALYYGATVLLHD